MNIYVDESGSFLPAEAPNSWNLVAAYVVPEKDRRKLQAIIESLRPRDSHKFSEIKLNQISETRYFEFLEKLSSLSGLLFSVATDMGHTTILDVEIHKDEQAKKVVAHVDKMIHASGRESLNSLSSTIRAMPNQLYVQTICQVELFYKVLWAAPLYYCQRIPQTLSEIRWRVDRKDLHVTTAEKTFRNVVPAVLQAKSIEHPIPHLIEGDYSHMGKYEFKDGEAPTYLTDMYGLEQRPAFNLGEMLSGNFKFEDSRMSLGIQAADLLSTGIFRLLRGRFKNNETAAELLGALMVGLGKGESPLQLITLAKGPQKADVLQSRRIDRLKSMHRPMLA